jgi:hypothetical protein
VGPRVGADLLHLKDVDRIAATGVASIGGAGTFEGIVLSGILSAYLARRLCAKAATAPELDPNGAGRQARRGDAVEHELSFNVLLAAFAAIWSTTMPVQIVMDSFGDTRHGFDSADVEAVVRAEERFRELTRKGFRAVALGKGGEPGRLLRKFEPEVEQTLFIPQLQGG